MPMPVAPRELEQHVHSLCVVGLDRFEQDPDDDVVGRDMVGEIVEATDDFPWRRHHWREVVDPHSQVVCRKDTGASPLAGRSGFRRRVACWRFRLVADVTEGPRRLGRTSLWNRRRCGCVPGAVRLLDCSLCRPPADARRRTTSNVGWKWLSVKGRRLRCSSLESSDRNVRCCTDVDGHLPKPINDALLVGMVLPARQVVVAELSPTGPIESSPQASILNYINGDDACGATR